MTLVLLDTNAYLRELRNSVVHRGLNITSTAHIDGNFPMFVAPERVTSQPGKDGTAKKSFLAFDTYLLGIITKCESVIGSVMQDVLGAAGMLEARIDPEDAVAEYREAVEQSSAMPEFAKAMARAVEFKPEWVEVAHRAAMESLRKALEPCSTVIQP